jgi:uncharacterized membrane protein
VAGGEPAIEGTDFGRILAFTDGVFAIAITLLVLGFDVPTKEADVTHEVLNQWPQLLAYFLSFAVIGRLWLVHHRFFAALHRFDAQLLRLNLAYLSVVVLVPYTTNLIGEHGGDPVAAITYAAVLAVAASLNWVIIHYTLRREHVRPAARAAVEQYGSWQGLIIPVVFVLSIPVAVFRPNIAEVLWILLGLQAVVRQRVK